MEYRILESYLENKSKKDRGSSLYVYRSEIMQLYKFTIKEASEYKTINSEKDIIKSIDYIMLCEYLNAYKYKPSTYNKKLNIIKNYFGFLYSVDILDKDISKPIIFIPNDEVEESIKEKDILNKEEVELITNSCKSNKDKLLYTLIFTSGCRIGEILKIELDWIEKIEIDGELTIQISIPKKVVKNKVNRTIYLVGEMINYFNSYLENERNKKNIVQEHEKYLFLTNRGRSYLTIKEDRVVVRAGEINKKIKTIMNHLEINKHITSHCFRHSHVVELQGQGMDLITINDNIGWKVNNPLFTTYSNHSTEEKMKNSINIVKSLI